MLSQCAQQSETISIATLSTNGTREIKLYNGESEPTSYWPSPVILDQHSVEHLEVVAEKLQRIGGQAKFVDGFNGQVVISVSLPSVENPTPNRSATELVAPATVSQASNEESRDD